MRDADIVHGAQTKKLLVMTQEVPEIFYGSNSITEVVDYGEAIHFNS